MMYNIDTNLYCTDLNTRAIHVLFSAGIKTVGDLINLTEYDVQCIKGVGVTTQRHIRAVLAANGMSLKKESWEV